MIYRPHLLVHHCRSWRAGGPLLVAALLGCANPLEQAHPAAKSRADPGSGLEDAFAGLPGETLAAVNAYIATVSVPEISSFRNNAELAQAYSDGYRKGYAFAYVTGKGYLRDQASQQGRSELDNTRLLGWFDGNNAGRLTRRLAEIVSAVGRIQSNRSR